MISKTLTVFLISGVLMSFSSGENPHSWKKKAQRIHDKCLTVDTHCDTPTQMIKPGFNIRDKHKAPKSSVDLPRMKSGELDAMFFRTTNKAVR